MSKKDSHTNQNTQQYNGYSVHPQYNQRLNSVPFSSNQIYKKKYESGQSYLCTSSHDLNIQISMCSINVCGLNSKLKYNVLQDCMQQFEVVCLTETKCDAIEKKKIVGFESFIMSKSWKDTTMGVFTVSVCL